MSLRSSINITFLSSVLLVLTVQQALTSGAAGDLLPEDTRPIKVITFDGGGIRGLATLEVARAIQDRLGGGVSLVEAVDVIAGTSTGGIMAIGLAHGCTINQLIDLYVNHGHDIFKKDGWNLWRSVRSLWAQQYTDTGLVGQLHAILGADTKFGDLQKQVIVTSYDLAGGLEGIPAPYIFNSRNPAFANVDLWKGARATSAAPTYFDPYCGIPGRVLIDGGVIANHPGDVALKEILSAYPVDLRDEAMTRVSMVSIGTGNFDVPMTAAQARGMGKLEWAGPISGVMMAGASTLVDRALRTNLGDARYCRLQFQLAHEIPLDGVTPEEIHALHNVARIYIRDHPREIDDAARLMQR